jgi:hypothetical protein
VVFAQQRPAGSGAIDADEQRRGSSDSEAIDVTVIPLTSSLYPAVITLTAPTSRRIDLRKSSGK